MRAIDEKDILKLHDTFLMFGDPEAPYWFLGLEEGDHPDENQQIDAFIHGLLRKTDKYTDAGKTSLRDLCAPADGYKFLPKIDPGKKLSASGTKYQRTWGGYIKLLLSIELADKKQSWTITDVKMYQKYDLGALTLSGSMPKSCLMELFPMARRGRKNTDWPYAGLAARAGLGFLETAKSYQSQVQHARVKSLICQVDQYKPEYLVCFGAACRTAIRSVMDIEETNLTVWQGKKDVTVPVCEYNGTLIVFSNHPTSHGISNLYWTNLGSQLAGYQPHLSQNPDCNMQLNIDTAA